MKFYYITLAILMLFCLLLASTCKKENFAGFTNVQLNTPFEISLHEKAIIQGSNTVVEISEITDSRCPVDVQCFWAGEAKVKLNVTGPETNHTVLRFCIGQCQNRYQKADTLAIHFQNQAYTIILSEVNPYPGTGSKKKTAVFTVKKN